MVADFVKRHPVIPTLFAAIGIVVVLTFVVNAFLSAENPQHAGGHLALASGFLLLGAAAVRIWPPPRPTRTGRMARRALVVGCALVIVGLLAEAMGAFGYSGDEHRIEALTTIHNGSWPLGFLGILLILWGALLAIPAKVRTQSAL